MFRYVWLALLTLDNIIFNVLFGSYRNHHPSYDLDTYYVTPSHLNPQ